MSLSRLAPLLRVPALQRLTQETLLRMDAETAHGATINALKLGLIPEQQEPDPPELHTVMCGIELSNPVGMAAGFDKNGEVAKGLGGFGFGLVEVGSVTPKPQPGNDKPRLFRLPEAGGVINRMGFNSDGHDAVLRRLSGLHVRALLGVNLGANKDSADRAADYALGVTRFAPVADYLAVNVSSPNTPGLRDLQAGEALSRLLEVVLKARAKASVRVPVLLKIAPDLDEAQIDAVASAIAGTGLDGLIVSNTTISRETVAGLADATEAGGLSGKPLFALATQRLAQMRQRVGDLPIVGVGGVHSVESALAKFEAGANAIQLYSALVFEGFDLLARIKRGLAAAVRANGKRTIADLVGTRTEEWAAGRVRPETAAAGSSAPR